MRAPAFIFWVIVYARYAITERDMTVKQLLYTTPADNQRGNSVPR
jgi:hypothetical protein